MKPSPTLPSVYQLRIVLRGTSPLIWCHVLVRSDTTIAELHTILQIVFDWSDEHLHGFHIHGKDYGCFRPGGIGFADDPHDVRLTDFGLYRGERFRYVYDFIAYWACTIRLEAILPWDPGRHYPVCIGGRGVAPPEECRGAWAYMERLDQHHSHPPIEAMLVMADAVRAVLETAPDASVREAIGDLDELREAVDCIEVYQ